MPIVSLYLALTLLLLVLLAARVALFRNSNKIGLGTKSNHALERRVRAHGNLAEHAPFALLALAVLEYQAQPAWLLHTLGASFVLARLLHAQGLHQSSGYSFGRFFGTLLTWLMLLGCAALLLAFAGGYRL